MKRVPVDLDTATKQYCIDSTIHGCAELGQDGRCIAKAAWALIMFAVACLCGLLLHQFVVDVLRDPKITSISELDHLEEPPMIMIPVWTTPRPADLEPLDIDDIYNLTISYYISTDSYLEDQIEVPGKPDIIAAVENTRSSAQAKFLGYELYDTRLMLVGKELFDTFTVNKLISDQFIKSYPALEPLAQNDAYIKALIPKMKLLHVKDVRENITEFYKDRIPAQFFESIRVTECVDSCMGENDLKVEPLLSASIGLGYKFNLSVRPRDERNRKTSETTVTFNCDLLPGTQFIYWAIGTEHVLTDQDTEHGGDHSTACGWKGHLEIKLQKRVYHDRYCKQGMKSSCLTDCGIRIAKEYGTCFPYKGIPEIRRDVPFCTYEDINSDFLIENDKLCQEQCQTNRFLRICENLQVFYTKKELEAPETRGLEETQQNVDNKIYFHIKIDISNGLEELRIEPKYSAATILGSVGGIVGFGFGISIMSIVQVLFHCLGMICDGSWKKKPYPGQQE